MEDPKCFRCGSDLICAGTFDYDELGIDGEGVGIVYVCPECDAQIEAYLPDTKK